MPKRLKVLMEYSDRAPAFSRHERLEVQAAAPLGIEQSGTLPRWDMTCFKASGR
jgi:hypothetical protein